MILYILLIILLLLIYYVYMKFLHRSRRMVFYLEKIPGPKTLPILGNALDYLVTPDQLWDFTRFLNNKYYPISRVYSLKDGGIHIRHPDDVEILLSSSKNISKSKIYAFLYPWFGTGLLTSTGIKWQKRRKILTPAFHFNVLKEFSDIFDQEARRMVHDLQSEEEEEDVTVDLVPFITKYTLNAICETAMGTSLEGQKSSMDSFQKIYRKAIHDLGNLMLHRLLRPWLHPDFFFNLSPTSRMQSKCLDIVRGFSKKIIGERRKYHEDTQGIHLKEFTETNTAKDVDRQLFRKKRLAMLDLLIAAMRNGHIDEDGISEEVDTFMFEGHDTTAMGICFTLLLLAEHREIQARVREEFDNAIESSNGQITITELQKLSYLERCIKEALRLYPSVPFISRDVTDDIQLRDYFIPKDVMAHVHIYDLHRDPNFWPDPLRYDPDRFIPENSYGRHPFAYVPFSAGPRNCIGQKFAMLELKAIIGHLIHNFYLEPIDLAGEIRMMPDLVLRPKHSARIKLISRSK
ncbi:GSCOCT00003654001.2-RA-CDS [Cotesia congregata]|uniref:CYP4AB71 n=1 Tax=Cotesia congregata TaxID=51543 RepID=A0A8J2HSZ4_COTCN|nr:GSCOCT00003654001.2-RA-CDS [Cotesia congregata]CAG5107523.1 CYP4AB71 [Cotesia congregata]